MDTTILLYGADWCPDCVRAKTYLAENNIEYTFVDVDLDKDATKLVEKINKGKRIIPTLLINEKSYTNPDNPTLAKILGINEGFQITFFGADWCPDCVRAKEYLNSHRINFQFIDVDEHAWATNKVEAINNGKRIIPTLLINNKAYTNPDNVTLKEVLKLNEEHAKKMYDVIIIGAGAAGLTTSIYAQRDRYSSLILEKRNIGGNAYLTEKIENYPGFKTISGPDLMDRMAEQAKVYGAEIKTGIEVKDIQKEHNNFNVETTMGTYTAKSVVIGTGSTYRKLGIAGEDELIGSGIHFCATCDGAFYHDREVIVIGGGNSALEEGIFLSSFCKKVTIVHRGTEFKASTTYIEKLADIDNIEVIMNKTSLQFKADERGLFAGLHVKDNNSGEESIIKADGVFIFIGLVPNTQFLEGIVELNDYNFIKTKPGSVATNVDGIYAAGDCREGAVAQVAAATGEGVMASYAIKTYLSK